MENDDAIVGTILNRREALAAAGKWGLGVVAAGALHAGAEAAFQEKARREVQLVVTPALTEGPFFVDEKLKRANLIAGTKRPSVVRGIPLEFTLTLYRLTNGKFAPLSGATVDVWHADALGVYSDESNPMNHEDTAGQKWLRGYQVSDTNGLVRFQTIFPGWYPSRTTHIHFKVRQTIKGQTKEFTSQLFFDDHVADKIFTKAPYQVRDTRETRNDSDNIFGERVSDGSHAGKHLTLNLKTRASGGYQSALAVALTDNSLRKNDGRRHGPGGSGGPGGPPPGGFGGPPPFGGPGGPPPGGPGGPPPEGF
ncbi:MAG: hypothetical protein QM758_07465 [Armatimonas sp.]